jgi:hypothetical protein
MAAPIFDAAAFWVTTMPASPTTGEWMLGYSKSCLRWAWLGDSRRDAATTAPKTMRPNDLNLLMTSLHLSIQLKVRGQPFC